MRWQINVARMCDHEARRLDTIANRLEIMYSQEACNHTCQKDWYHVQPKGLKTCNQAIMGLKLDKFRVHVVWPNSWWLPHVCFGKPVCSQKEPVRISKVSPSKVAYAYVSVTFMTKSLHLVHMYCAIRHNSFSPVTTTYDILIHPNLKSAKHLFLTP